MEGTFDTKFMEWFYKRYRAVEDKKSFIQMRSIYNNYTFSELYKSLSKFEKRIYNRKYVYNLIISDEDLQKKYKKNLYYDKGCRQYSNCLTYFETKTVYSKATTEP